MNLPGKGSGGEPAEKRFEDLFLALEGQVAFVCLNGHYRANDEAYFASEQPPRTFGFAMGSGAVFVPQVEVYKNWESHRVSVFWLSLSSDMVGALYCRLLDFLAPAGIGMPVSGLAPLKESVCVWERRRGRLNSRRC